MDDIKIVTRCAVYRSDDNCFFSRAITRDFGENKVILLFDGSSIVNVVQPLKCEPIINGLNIVGTIRNAEK